MDTHYEDGYHPALYRPDKNKPIRVSIRRLSPLALQLYSDQSEDGRQRNITFTQRRIEAVGELDPKRILKCYGYRFGPSPFMIVANDGSWKSFSRLAKDDSLLLLDKLKLLCEAGKAIQYLHSRCPPIAHGAVHPRNILAKGLDEAVLSDFGLANVWRQLEKFVCHNAVQFSSCDIFIMVGMAGYTAPEYIENNTGEILPPGDVYSFASVILTVLSGRAPLEAVRLKYSARFMGLIAGSPPDPTDHPNLAPDDSLWPLLQRMWSSNPEDRPTMEEVMKELERELKIRGRELVPAILRAKL